VSGDINARLSRWSQRKLAARRGAVIDEPPEKKQPPVQEQDAKANDAAVQPTEETPALPSIEELTAESDYTVFFGKSVPEKLKNAALRKLWRSNPIFGHIDGLDDYAEDFNLIDTPITLAQTNYKIGKGFLDDVEEKLAKLDPAKSDDADHASEPVAVAAPEGETDGGALSQNDAAEDKLNAAARQPDLEEPAASPDEQAPDKTN
jgi:hypothetical protein